MIREITHDEIIAEADYDDCVNLGQQVKDDVDMGQFKLGDIGNALKQRYKDDNRQWYGNNVLASFAKDIQREKNTIQEYCNMSKFWIPDVRQHVIETYAVGYSVMKYAKRFKTHRRAEAFLRLCASEGINTADDYRRRANELGGKRNRPQKLGRVGAYCTESQNGAVILEMENVHPDLQKGIVEGEMYILDIYPVEVEEITE